MIQLNETITKRKDGRFMGRFISGYEDNGKARYQYVYGKTYKEAENKLIIGKAIEQLYLSGKSVSVKKAYNEWIYAVINHVKESTFSNYRLKFEKHILPEFGDMCCSELSAGVINMFISRKLKSGLSPSYVKDIIVVFKAMLKYAKEEYSFNLSLKNLRLPKCDKKTERKLCDFEQRSLVAYLKQHMNLTSFGTLVSLLMGLRIGELCGLKWSDVDFKNKTLYINRTVQRISQAEDERKTKIVISAPKSSSSRRFITIPDILMEYFKKFRAESESYILSGSDKPVEPRTMQYRYKKLLKEARIAYHSIHILRHTFATNCIQNGFDIKTLSNVLGHSSISLTLSRYIHPDIAHERRLMNKISMLL